MGGHLGLLCPAFEGGALGVGLELGYCGVLLLGFEFVEVLSFASVFVGFDDLLEFLFAVCFEFIRAWVGFVEYVVLVSVRGYDLFKGLVEGYASDLGCTYGLAVFSILCRAEFYAVYCFAWVSDTVKS